LYVVHISEALEIWCGPHFAHRGTPAGGKTKLSGVNWRLALQWSA
jgi:hypothetical protein